MPPNTKMRIVIPLPPPPLLVEGGVDGGVVAVGVGAVVAVGLGAAVAVGVGVAAALTVTALASVAFIVGSPSAITLTE